MNPRGSVIGEVVGARPDGLEIALGGARDVWGLVDLGEASIVTASRHQLLLGPRRTIGKSYVMLTTLAPL